MSAATSAGCRRPVPSFSKEIHPVVRPLLDVLKDFNCHAEESGEYWFYEDRPPIDFKLILPFIPHTYVGDLKNSSGIVIGHELRVTAYFANWAEQEENRRQRREAFKLGLKPPQWVARVVEGRRSQTSSAAGQDGGHGYSQSSLVAPFERLDVGRVQ